MNLFPPYRHLVAVRSSGRWPVKIERETTMAFETPQGIFVKASGRKFDDPSTTYEGPFSAEGDMESRP